MSRTVVERAPGPAYDARMLNRLSHTQLLRYAGLFTWAVVGIPLIILTWNFPADPADVAVAQESVRLAFVAAPGHVLIANGIVAAINTKYGTSLPVVQ